MEPLALIPADGPADDLPRIEAEAPLLAGPGASRAGRPALVTREGRPSALSPESPAAPFGAPRMTGTTHIDPLVAEFTGRGAAITARNSTGWPTRRAPGPLQPSAALAGPAWLGAGRSGARSGPPSCWRWPRSCCWPSLLATRGRCAGKGGAAGRNPSNGLPPPKPPSTRAIRWARALKRSAEGIAQAAAGARDRPAAQARSLGYGLAGLLGLAGVHWPPASAAACF